MDTETYAWERTQEILRQDLLAPNISAVDVADLAAELAALDDAERGLRTQRNLHDIEQRVGVGVFVDSYNDAVAMLRV